MAILYTQKVLTASLSVTKSSYYLWEPPYRHGEDFTLGNNAKHDNPSEGYYWESVRKRLLDIMVYNQYMPRPAKVLLLGESAHDETVRGVLTEALKSVMEDMPEIPQEGTEDIWGSGSGRTCQEIAMESIQRAVGKSGSIEFG